MWGLDLTVYQLPTRHFKIVSLPYSSIYVHYLFSCIGFSPQLVNITGEEELTAGYAGYTLVCLAERENHLPTSSSIAAQWFGPDNTLINDGMNFIISGSSTTTSTVLTSRLTFNSVYTSQAGVYTCRTLLTIPGVVINDSVEVNLTVKVKCKSLG